MGKNKNSGIFHCKMLTDEEENIKLMDYTYACCQG